MRKIKLDLARRPHALPNALVHPLQQPLLFQFGAAAATVLVEQRVVRHIRVTMGASPACSQCVPRQALLFVRRFSWHGCSEGCLCVGYHVALLVALSICIRFFVAHVGEREQVILRKRLCLSSRAACLLVAQAGHQTRSSVRRCAQVVRRVGCRWSWAMCRRHALARFDDTWFCGRLC